MLINYFLGLKNKNSKMGTDRPTNQPTNITTFSCVHETKKQTSFILTRIIDTSEKNVKHEQMIAMTQYVGNKI